MPSEQFFRRLQRAVSAFCIGTAIVTVMMMVIILDEAAPRIAVALAAQ